VFERQAEELALDPGQPLVPFAGEYAVADVPRERVEGESFGTAAVEVARDLALPKGRPIIPPRDVG